MSPQLSPAERRALKARAHGLAPTVMIGTSGLTPAVVQEIDRTLSAHELIKVRVPDADRVLREDILKRICDDLGAFAVQHVGKILVLYRARPETTPKPPPRTSPQRAKKREPRSLKRSFQNRA